MNSITRLVALVAGLVLALHITPSWSAGTPNPTDSDANGNTAGGTDALLSLPGPSGGFNNTAFGQSTLYSNTARAANTAIGPFALYYNSTGSNNTASGVEALLTNTTGSNNTASGYLALGGNTTGNNNTASGVGTTFEG